MTASQNDAAQATPQDGAYGADGLYPPTFAGVLQVQDKLLGPDGCPWDREQTPATLKESLREECHELLDAMDEGDSVKIAEEMGDALFNVLFQMRLAADAGDFAPADAQRALTGKAVAAAAAGCDTVAAILDFPAPQSAAGDARHKSDGAARRPVADARLNSDAAQRHDADARLNPDAAAQTQSEFDFAELQALIDETLGGAGALGCADASPRALAPQIKRRCYALMRSIDPIPGGGERGVCEAIGDALFALGAAMRAYERGGAFAAADVFGALVSKLTRRHPHVFGDARVGGVDDVLANWDAIKRGEKPRGASALDGVPRGMPPLAYAQAIQRRAARLGFDWQAYADVVDKAAEEVAELEAAASPDDRAAEFGDLLFSAVNAARWLGVEAETALDKRNRQAYCGLRARSPQSYAVAALSDAYAPGAAGALEFAQRFHAALADDGADAPDNADDRADARSNDNASANADAREPARTGSANPQRTGMQSGDALSQSQHIQESEESELPRRSSHSRGNDVSSPPPNAAAHPSPKSSFEHGATPAPHAADADDVIRRLRGMRRDDGAGDDGAARELSAVFADLAGDAHRRGLDAEAALRGANQRFYRRFAAMERAAQRQGLDFKALPLDAKEALWQAAKADEAARM